MSLSKIGLFCFSGPSFLMALFCFAGCSTLTSRPSNIGSEYIEALVNERGTCLSDSGYLMIRSNASASLEDGQGSHSRYRLVFNEVGMRRDPKRNEYFIMPGNTVRSLVVYIPNGKLDNDTADEIIRTQIDKVAGSEKRDRLNSAAR